MDNIYETQNKNKMSYNDELTEKDFYPPADNRMLHTYNIEDFEDEEEYIKYIKEFEEYTEYIYDLYEEEGFYEN